MQNSSSSVSLGDYSGPVKSHGAQLTMKVWPEQGIVFIEHEFYAAVMSAVLGTQIAGTVVSRPDHRS